MKTILFVCTGNTCRSPMAEAIFNKLAAEKGIMDIKARSAGIAADDGAPAAVNATAAVREIGADLKNHAARRLTREMVHSSAAVYTMTQADAELLKKALPADAAKILVLGKDIPDPFGGDIEIYRMCRDSILAAVKNITDKVK